MPKRGQKMPYKVRFRWPSMARPATIACATLADAEMRAGVQRARINPQTGEADCVVTVEGPSCT